MLALITGASSGIGRDMARVLSQKGYDLILVARRKDRLEELQKELQTKVEIIALDLSKKENCIQLFEQTKDQPIDFVILNAGFGHCGYFHEMEMEQLTNMIQVNVEGLTVLFRLYLHLMKERNHGYIMNVASAAAFTTGPLMAEYYATKAYVYQLTLAVYEELRRMKSKVRVSVLCPGPVKTEFDEVADVRFQMKSQTSEFVARFAIQKALKGKLILIPSKKIAIGKFFTRFVSEKTLAKIGYSFQKKKI